MSSNPDPNSQSSSQAPTDDMSFNIDTPASSNIATIRYDHPNSALYVTFKSKSGIPTSTYLVANVTPELAAQFRDADSVGQFYNSQIKNAYTITRV